MVDPKIAIVVGPASRRLHVSRQLLASQPGLLGLLRRHLPLHLARTGLLHEEVRLRRAERQLHHRYCRTIALVFVLITRLRCLTENLTDG